MNRRKRASGYETQAREQAEGYAATVRTGRSNDGVEAECAAIFRPTLAARFSGGHRTRRQFEKLRGASNTARCRWVIQNSQLIEHRGLIPKKMLAGHLAALKPNNAHEDEFNFAIRGRHTREHPIHFERMRKADHELFDNSNVAEDLRKGNKFEIRREIWQHLISIELTHGCATYPARPGRNVEHVRVLGH